MEEVVELRKATKDEELSRRRRIDGDGSSSDEEIELDPREQQERLEKITTIGNLLTG